ncbi:Uncharacterised protein [uncultured archaeon]|nr:Uncharacterised protein [uncultured archaeon]
MQRSELNAYFKTLEDNGISLSVDDVPLAVIAPCSCCAGNNSQTAEMVRRMTELALGYHDNGADAYTNMCSTRKREKWENWFLKGGNSVLDSSEVGALRQFYDFCKDHCGKPKVVIMEDYKELVPA